MHYSWNFGQNGRPIKREGIKGHILRHCGKLNSTHPGELRKPQCTRWNVVYPALRLVHCGSYIQIWSCRNAQAAMHEMNHIPSRAMWLVHCGGAAVGVEDPHYKPFYTVPYQTHFTRKSKISASTGSYVKGGTFHVLCICPWFLFYKLTFKPWTLLHV